MSAPNGICKPPFRVAWGTQHLRQRYIEVGVSCSLKIILVVRERERQRERGNTKIEIEKRKTERKKEKQKQKYYFTSCDPHHDISRCIFGHISYSFGPFI